MPRYFYIISLICILLSSCTSAKTTVSQTADLSIYEYATLINVMGYEGSAGIMDAEIKIYDAISNSRLDMISENLISELSDEEKKHLLLAKFAVTQKTSGTDVSVNFVDYMSGRPIASCIGSCGSGIHSNIDFDEAIKLVSGQIMKTFPRPASPGVKILY